jgi:hypothetical protein
VQANPQLTFCLKVSRIQLCKISRDLFIRSVLHAAIFDGHARIRSVQTTTPHIQGACHSIISHSNVVQHILPRTIFVKPCFDAASQVAENSYIQGGLHATISDSPARPETFGTYVTLFGLGHSGVPARTTKGRCRPPHSRYYSWSCLTESTMHFSPSSSRYTRVLFSLSSGDGVRLRS